MINNKVKQLIFPNDIYSIQELQSNIIPLIFQNQKVNIQRVLIKAPPTLSVYVNNDICPIIIGEDGTYDYDVTEFKQINNLYCIFPYINNSSKYCFEDSEHLVEDNANGKTLSQLWEYYAGTSIVNNIKVIDNIKLADSAGLIMGLISALLIFLKQDISTIDSAFFLMLKELLGNDGNIGYFLEEENPNVEDWFAKLRTLIQFGNTLEIYEGFREDSQIIITFFYTEEIEE